MSFFSCRQRQWSNSGGGDANRKCVVIIVFVIWIGRENEKERPRGKKMGRHGTGAVCTYSV